MHAHCPDAIWTACIHSFCTVFEIERLARACAAHARLAAATLRQRESAAPGLRAAVRRLQRHFSPARRRRLHATGLHAAARHFLDGRVSGITIGDVLIYEKIVLNAYSPQQNRELALWTLMHYETHRGRRWRLTVRSVLEHLLSGPVVRTIYGARVHALRFLALQDGKYHLPRAVRDCKGEHQNFYSWGYYCRMSGCESDFESYPQLADHAQATHNHNRERVSA